MDAPSNTLALADTIVMFDWNGTVVLDADRARASLNSVLAARSLGTLNSEEFSQRFRLPMRRMFRDLGVQPLDLDEAEAEWNYQMTQTSTCLRAGVNAAFLELSAAGAWLGVVSAASAAAVQFDQRSLSVPSVLDAVDSEVADKVVQLSKHRDRRNRAFYVGDTAYDMRSATAAGYIPIGVAGGYSTEDVLWEAGAVHIVESLREIISIVSDSADQAESL
ncbi:HAD family hydrolase [Cryobacterium sp. Hh7]|jgi:phosphoglycolate phosphatase|uniref:HAD family hydrolase n=1 Tax=Cryobacterium sp. Hh7 TaxID=1259159 RepID=UPI001F543339|nr:HAD hydrolase-like protein [Cryobacterium sp. Hh7]